MSPTDSEPSDRDATAPAAISALGDLHEAASTLVATVIDAESTVRDAASRLGISQRLAWTLLNFTRASTIPRMVRFLPGRRGWATLLDRFEALGGETAPLVRTRETLAAFDRIRRASDIDLASLGQPAAKPLHAATEASRREEFLRHRSGWPIQAQTKVMAFLVAPDVEEPALGSMASVMMLFGLDRSTPGPPLEVARTMMPAPVLRQRLSPGRAIETVFGFGGSLPPLLEACSTPGVASQELEHLEDDRGYLRVGFTALDPKRRAPLRLAFGQFAPRLGPLHGGPDDEVVFALETPGPVEWAVLDLLWHREVPAGGPWTARLSTFAAPAGVNNMASAKTFPHLIDEIDSTRIETLALPGIAQSETPHYRKALRSAAEALGRTLEEFEIHRSVLRYSLPRTSIVASRPLAPPSTP